MRLSSNTCIPCVCITILCTYNEGVTVLLGYIKETSMRFLPYIGSKHTNQLPVDLNNHGSTLATEVCVVSNSHLPLTSPFLIASNKTA